MCSYPETRLVKREGSAQRYLISKRTVIIKNFFQVQKPKWSKSDQFSRGNFRDKFFILRKTY